MCHWAAADEHHPKRADASVLEAMSRIYARETLTIVIQQTMEWLRASDAVAASQGSDFAASLGTDILWKSYGGWLADMDHVARAVFGLAVNYATSPRGACHERGNPQACALGLFYPDCEMDAPPDRFDEDQAGYTAMIYQNASMLFNNITMCKFMVNNGGLSITDITLELEYATGMKMTTMELLKTAERGMALQRLVNVRDGITRKDDTLPPKMRQPSIVGGREGKTPLNFDKMLDDYYKLRGWDSNGIPTKETLEALDLGDYIKYLP